MIIVKSSAFINGGHIPDKYGCNGDNVNPPIELYDLPENAKSIALIVVDPDSPSGHFIHWLLFNIPATTHNIEENSVPYGAIQGKNDFGHNGYGGPCPSYGTHHYEFRVYALDDKLELYEGATKIQIDKAMEGHILGQGELVGLYEKK